MSRIIGVGGVFLNLKGDDLELRNWYQNVLKLDMTEYGTGFIEGTQLLLVSFTHSNKPGVPYINFRVDNLDDMIVYLREQKVEITKDTEEYPYGKFAQFKDPFGNYIELWEPYIEEYKKMVLQEIENYKKTITKL